MPHSTASPITVHKIEPPKGSDIDFGAEIRGADVENITGKFLPTPIFVKSTI